MSSTAPALLKLTFLVVNVVAGFLASRDPGKFHPPSSSQRLKVSGWEHCTHGFVAVLRIGTIILPLCEVLTILTLFTGPESVYYTVVSTLLPFSKMSNAYRLSISPAFVMLSSISGITGALFRRHCFIVLGRYFTYDLSIREGHKLITNGPYSILVRGSWLTECTVVGHLYWRLAIVTVMCVCIYPWAYARMDKEDQMLRKKFGREWDMWREAVPYWLVPGVY
ncbi:hypothetical protein ONZ45_g14930 [Pleurotus djamor]|nr:hypothetical protein ONZ45_g14930 [Pleurotus djamor]